MASIEPTVETSNLPEAFAMRGPDGMIEQITDPCYQCKSPQFLGDTWYDEGEIITTGICPNFELEPLNKAAGANMAKWLGTLPDYGKKVAPEFMLQAATKLRDHPQLAEMSEEKYNETVYKLAVKLSEKDATDRNGGMTIPPISLNEARRAGRNGAAPMANARFTDPTMQGPGARDRAVLHEPARGAPAAARVKPPLSNAPPAAGR